MNIAHQALTEIDSVDVFKSIANSFAKNHFKQVDALIKSALEKNGLDCNDTEFLKSNVTRIDKSGEDFEHWYFRFGQPDEVRLISFQKQPDIKFSDDHLKATTTMNYY